MVRVLEQDFTGITLAERCPTLKKRCAKLGQKETELLTLPPSAKPICHCCTQVSASSCRLLSFWFIAINKRTSSSLSILAWTTHETLPRRHMCATRSDSTTSPLPDPAPPVQASTPLYQPVSRSIEHSHGSSTIAYRPWELPKWLFRSSHALLSYRYWHSRKTPVQIRHPHGWHM